MHDGANTHDPAIHGGGVHWWRGAWLAEYADVYPAVTDGGFAHPAVHNGGARTGPPKALSLPLSYPTRARILFSLKKFRKSVL